MYELWMYFVIIGGIIIPLATDASLSQRGRACDLPWGSLIFGFLIGAENGAILLGILLGGAGWLVYREVISLLNEK